MQYDNQADYKGDRTRRFFDAVDLRDRERAALGGFEQGERTEAGATGDDPEGDVAHYLARGLHPDEVGRLAIEGIANGDFWLLPHPDLTFALLEARHDAMRRRELAPEEVWTDQ